MRYLFYLLLILIALMGLAFASLNAESVTFNYFLASVQVSLSVLLMGALIVGVLLGWMVSMRWWVVLKSQNRHLQSRLNDAEKELTQLRQLPVKSAH